MRLNYRVDGSEIDPNGRKVSVDYDRWQPTIAAWEEMRLDVTTRTLNSVFCGDRCAFEGKREEGRGA